MSPPVRAATSVALNPDTLQAMPSCNQCGRPLNSGELNVCSACSASGTLQPAGPEAAAAPQRAPEPVEAHHAPMPRLLVTPVLVGICVLVFAAMLVARISPTQPTTEQLIRWGADFGPATLGGQWWRLLTSMFVHIGFLHLAVNMWCLWNLGALAETVFGRATFAAVYLATGVAGAITSVGWNPLVTSAGASGAIFGVAGALIAFFYLAHLPFAREAVKSTLRSLLIFAGVNLFFGFRKTAVDNAAHVGGLVSGLLIGAVLARLASRPEHRPRRTYVFSGTAALLLIACVLLARTRGFVVHLERGREALGAHKWDPAISELNLAIAQKPKLAPAYFLLGEAYLHKRQFAPAEAAYRRVIELDSRANEARFQLGQAVLLQGRNSEAAQIFTDLMKRDPRNPAGYVGFGQLAATNGNAQAAYKAFAIAAKLDPTRPQTFFDMGVAAMQAGAWDAAIEAFTSAVKLDPGNYNATLGLADAYRAKGMNKEAEAAYEKALALAPKK